MKKDKIIHDFENEWQKFNQMELDKNELKKIFEDYFYLMPWSKINKNSVGIDVGCGTGRWAQFVAPKCKKIHLLDAGKRTLEVAKKFLSQHKNITFILSDLKEIPIIDQKYDFAYSLGVLHHVPNVDKAIKEIHRILKPGSPFLIYLYYSFENSPVYFRLIWKISDFIRKNVCKYPKFLKMLICDIIALFIYLPLAKASLILERFKIKNIYFPLSYYKDKSFYTMRTDSLDRFGTTFEKRYSKKEIYDLLASNGFHSIKFSPGKPYWCALAYKK